MSAFNLTDKNWTNGVSNSVAAFFVSNILKNVEKYKIGRRIKFINGEIRIIKKITVSSRYINIYLDGKPLDGTKVGYPHEIQVINGESK